MTIAQTLKFLESFDRIAANRFARLALAQKQIAVYGISRHLKAYAKLESERRADGGAIHEILVDSAKSISIAAENDQEALP